MKTDLQDLLLAHEPLTAKLAKDPEDNVALINWITRPDLSALPAITLEGIGTTPQYDQKGRSGFQPTRIQFDIWSSTFAAGTEIFNVIHEWLEPEGSFPTRTQGGTIFDRFELQADRDLPVTDLAGGGRVFHIAADFIVWHRKAVQT